MKKTEPYQCMPVHRRHQGTEEREMCLPHKNPTRDASLCSATKSISHSLTSPPLWCHSFIRFPVAMATLLLGAVHSFTSVFLSFYIPPPLQIPMNPAHYSCTVTPPTTQASTPLFTTITLPSWCKKMSRRVGNKKGGGAWIHLMEHTCPEDFVVKKAYFFQGCLWDSNKPDTTEPD